MARLRSLGFLFLAVPVITSGCKDQEVRDYIKNDLHRWNAETVLPALEMLCDLERLIYQGTPDGNQGYDDWVQHGPIPQGTRTWCSVLGAGDPPAPPEPPPAWGD
jgi:hypothetical protein